MGQSKPIPRGLHTITPSLVFRDCGRAIQFYERAFGAREIMRMRSPDGARIWHAELQIGDSRLYLADELPGATAHAPTAMEPAAVSIQLYVEDCDALFAQAVKAGAHATMKLDDQFWGDRMGTITDPFGYQWSISTHVRDVSERELLATVAAMRQPPAPTPEDLAAWRQAEEEEREASTSR